MGYVKTEQTTMGIHLRLFSRAFIIEDPASDTRVVYVCVDAAMIPQLLKKKVRKTRSISNLCCKFAREAFHLHIRGASLKYRTRHSQGFVLWKAQIIGKAMVLAT